MIFQTKRPRALTRTLTLTRVHSDSRHCAAAARVAAGRSCDVRDGRRAVAAKAADNAHRLPPLDGLLGWRAPPQLRLGVVSQSFTCSRLRENQTASAMPCSRLNASSLLCGFGRWVTLISTPPGGSAALPARPGPLARLHDHDGHGERDARRARRQPRAPQASGRWRDALAFGRGGPGARSERGGISYTENPRSLSLHYQTTATVQCAVQLARARSRGGGDRQFLGAARRSWRSASSWRSRWPAGASPLARQPLVDPLDDGVEVVAVDFSGLRSRASTRRRATGIRSKTPQ